MVGSDGGGEHEDGAGFGEAVERRPGPGDIVVGSGLWSPEPLVGKDESTPLEEDEPEGVVPPSPLWAMKLRRHIQWHLLPSHERHDRVRDRLGEGDDAVYVIDDGRHHVMVGRRVGERAGECEYCLIGRTDRDRYDQLRAGSVPLASAFAGATGLTVCGVVEQEDLRSSIVFDVARYDDVADVPPEYRPGAPYLELAEDLEIIAD